ncbi:putative biotin protein ligase [Lophium mytilinum]|uniref:Putative biotin protein ligase n=1 Tax=Lophium mytilinum TaxID=390894 RepID=A0A6A6R7E9_9PEZI|nr:putative biotin protein ligase [Lophium mytilinum]
MASRRMNVLVYSGNGSTSESVRHTLYTLRRLLSPKYAVIPISGETLLKEPWTATCALIVFPGGADLGYCRTLDGAGNRKITQFVNRGGSYLGFCAGGYYGSARCEFEVDDKKMAVVGDRELGFFPGTCRGLAFPGFVYQSEAGARAVELEINKSALPSIKNTVPGLFRSYYNGGGVFVDAKKLAERGVEILASFKEELNVDSGDSKAAVVYRKIGEGSAIVTGPHPEFAPINLNKSNGPPSYAAAIDAIAASDATRVAFMKACLVKLGLQVNEEEQPVPSLSRLHLTAHTPSDVAEILASWHQVTTVIDGTEYVQAENDTFHVEKPATWGMSSLMQAVTSVLPDAVSGISNESRSTEDPSSEEKVLKAESSDESTSGDKIIDYDKVIKRIVPHEKTLPTGRETPSFNHDAYYANLAHFQSKSDIDEPAFGSHLLYGEVVTSTNTLLEKNPKLLNTLPQGFTATATMQVAGRGRGSNVWLAPPGSLIFSTVIRHPISLTASAPVIFVQYLAALAFVKGAKGYAPGYDRLPIKLKWPNDIYALSPTAPKPTNGRQSNTDFVKIGGILVNSSYSGSEYTLVVGVGINVANPSPTTSLNQLAAKEGLKAIQMEKLLASILVEFETLYRRFCAKGWDRDTEGAYYDDWLHTNQIVELEAEGGVRARVKGITRDWGLLLAEELGWEDRPTGKIWQLQSDSNSFDFFKGLVKRKV